MLRPPPLTGCPASVGIRPTAPHMAQDTPGAERADNCQAVLYAAELAKERMMPPGT